MSKIVEIYRHRSSLVLENKLPFNEYNDIPMPYRATAKDWRDGLNLAEEFHIRKYQRHRRELLKYGIDIAVPCNVQALPIKIKEINVAALVAPDWYKQKYA